MKNKDNDPKKIKKPWPTKDAMEQVYKLKLWGDNQSDFYSGNGSHNSGLVKPYIEAVSTFLMSFRNPITLCDLGCGDFNIGKELVQHTKQYIAVDIVPDLITRNKEKFKAGNLEFQCLNIAADNLPNGDCALLRQVLQHISNAEVQSVLNKLTVFKYVILTEHLPTGDFKPNIDIISGQGIRLKKQSGLNVLAPPFIFKPVAEEELLSLVLSDEKGVITTTLYTMF
ncbi:class I SAM-dependent methyltransferase [Bizionia argentinensis JUB59]|uniref:Class I SAM-dependent methyltransferase n=1 Tax=Bizionia argentinensis JUB59 TaxID=1046627 RepID=G2E927_9FLAO|nr:class I SAM-dependent methyltransferase [Bizionia argentinensis]EGV45035.1 class I SAM-dependent methyltransferase [Bizionia argentinensis JUB59]